MARKTFKGERDEDGFSWTLSDSQLLVTSYWGGAYWNGLTTKEQRRLHNLLKGAARGGYSRRVRPLLDRYRQEGYALGSEVVQKLFGKTAVEKYREANPLKEKR